MTYDHMGDVWRPRLSGPRRRRRPGRFTLFVVVVLVGVTCVPYRRAGGS